MIIYVNLANVLDILSLVNCYVGFIAYCFLSSKYRETFIMMILTTMEKSPKPVKVDTGGNTSKGLLDEVIIESNANGINKVNV